MESDTPQSDSSPVPLLIEGNGDFWTDSDRFVWCRPLAANVAPTEEIIMIATETASEKLRSCFWVH